MKKPTIHQEAKEFRKQLMKDDEQFLDEILQEHFGTTRKQIEDKKRKKVFVSVFATIAVFVVSLIILLPMIFPEGKHYLFENESTEYVLAEEVNDLLKEYSLTVSSDTMILTSAVRGFDTKYNDVLYYQCKINKSSTLEQAVIYFYCNPEYERQKRVEGTFKTQLVGTFSVEYIEERVPSQDDIFSQFVFIGYFEVNGINIYIEYEQLTPFEYSNFFDFIQQTIQILS